MEKRYGIVVCALLLLLGTAPMHCAQEQKEDNDVPLEQVKDQKHDVQQVVYGYFIPQGGMAAEEHKEILQIFKQKQAADDKWLATVEEMYRKQFSYLNGEKHEQAVVEVVTPVKQLMIEGRISEIYKKAKDLEKNGGGQWFDTWKSKVVKQ